MIMIAISEFSKSQSISSGIDCPARLRDDGSEDGVKGRLYDGDVQDYLYQLVITDRCNE